MAFRELTTDELKIINAYHKWFNEVATYAERKGELAYLKAIAEPSVADLLNNDDEPETSHYHRATEPSEPAKMKLPGQD